MTRLEDLYQVHSGPITIGEGNKTETVVCRKLDELEMDLATRRASAARARVLRNKHDDDSDMWLSAYDVVLSVGDDVGAMALVLGREELAQQALSVRERIASEPPWVDDDYLVGLEQAWAEDLKEIYEDAEADPDDPKRIEAEQVAKVLQEYEDLCSAEMVDVQATIVARYENVPLETLRGQMVESIITREAEEAWFEELVRSRIWQGTRVHQTYPGTDDLDLSIRYFADRAAIDRLAPRVRLKLASVFGEMDLSGTAGKGSPAPAGSSTPSAPSPASATDEPSGPVAATG